MKRCSNKYSTSSAAAVVSSANPALEINVPDLGRQRAAEDPADAVEQFAL